MASKIARRHDQTVPEYISNSYIAFCAVGKRWGCKPSKAAALPCFSTAMSIPNSEKVPSTKWSLAPMMCIIKITEKTERRPESAVLVPLQHRPAQPGQRGLDTYEASLTGDIWMKISHRYTEAEANAMLPKDMPMEIRDAVLRIYAGLKSVQLQVHIPARGAAAAMKMNLRFQEQDNATKNIKSCSLLQDVLPRTHPHAFAALMTEAYAAGVNDISVTSCWRPMLGSIVHRAGLGLDVVAIANDHQTVKLNRVGLLTGQDNPNVSKVERGKYEKFVEASTKVKSYPEGKERASAELIKDNAKEKWEQSLVSNEPPLMNSFRERLQKNQCISQTFDPWYMEANTQDLKPQVPNLQLTPVETLHATHLHITIKDENIL